MEQSPNPERGAKPPAERVLVVDDEEVMRELICLILTAVAGYECEQAEDGLEALTVLESGQKFDLLLTNFQMPNLDGVGLLERVKVRSPEMPVVIYSAMYNVDVISKAITNGAFEWLQTPFAREELLAVVRRALDSRRVEVNNR